MLVGSFMFTFCVLSLAWLTLVGSGQQRVSGDPTVVSPAPSLTAPPSANVKTPMPGASGATEKPGKPTSSPQPSSSSVPSTLKPSFGSTTTETYVLVGGAYTATEIPDGGSITPSGGGVALVTSTEADDRLRVTYGLDASELPAGVSVVRVAVRVCGEATGTNYEIDGP